MKPWRSLLLTATLTTALPVGSAPLTFNTALPVAEGEYLLRQQFIVNQSGHDPGMLARDRNAATSLTVLGYGINHRLAVFGALPYQDIDLELTKAGRRITRSASGFGDLTLFGRYTVVQRDRPGSSFRIAPFAGVKTPTGDDRQSDALGRLPAAAQVGSGSWDPLIGMVATYQTLDYEVDGQIAYQARTRAHDFESGDIARMDASLQYRLWPRQLDSGVPGFLYGILETNLIHQQKDRLAGIRDPNSGGTRLFLTPGLQYVTRRWVLEGAVQLPVLQELNGTALENDYIARIGLRINF